MGAWNKFIIGLLLAASFVAPMAAQSSDATEILERVEAGFRKAGGVRVEFAMQASSGKSEGIIELEGEKFVLHAGGMTTWFDGRTQWTCLPSGEEVNVSEPTAEELQSLNPYAWLSLYRNGYRAQFYRHAFSADTARYYCVLLTAAHDSTELQSLIIYVQKNTYRPARIVLQQGGEEVEITIVAYQDGLSWADNHFSFDVSKHPGIEVIDMR